MPFDWTPFEGDKWSAERVGDRIEGRLKALRIEEGRKGQLPVLTLTTREGRDVEVWPSSYLQRELAGIGPQVGDALQITLTELRNTGQPKPMKVYEVKHKTRDQLARPTGEAPTSPSAPPKDDLGPDPSKWEKVDEEPF